VNDTTLTYQLSPALPSIQWVCRARDVVFWRKRDTHRLDPEGLTVDLRMC